MIYFIVTFILIFFSYHFDYRNQKKGKQAAYYIVILMFILVAGLRYRIGVDSIRYEAQYLSLPTFIELLSFDFSSVRAEPGYVILNSIARSFSDSFVAMQFLHATFVNIAILHFFKTHTTKIFSASLLYFIFPFMYLNYMCEVMRESCAVVCFLTGWIYFKKRQWLKYYFFAILATLFHVSGFVTLFLPLLYLPGLRSFFVLDKRMIFVLITTFLIGGAINVWLFDYIQALTFFDSLQDKAEMYADSDLSGMTVNIKGILAMFIPILYPWISFLLICKKNGGSEINRELEFMLAICFIFIVLSIPIALAYRYTNYFYPFAIITICNCLFQPVSFCHKIRQFAFRAWILILFPLISFELGGLFRTIPGTQLSGWMEFYPYSSRIWPEKNAQREQIYQYYNAW